MASEVSSTQAEVSLARVAADHAKRQIQSREASDSCQPIAREMTGIAAKFAGRVPANPEVARQRAAEAARREAERAAAPALEAWNRAKQSIGARYASATFASYQCYDKAQGAVLEQVREYARNLPAHVDRGEGLILFGPCGTGKDHLMTCVLREAAVTHKMPVSHVYGLDLHAQVRDRMDDERLENTLRQYREARVLGISDPIPNAGGLTDWQRQTMMRLVNARYVAMRTTLLTINAPSLDQNADPREQVNVWNEMTDAVLDRLTQGAVVVRCYWPSFRQRAQQ